MNLLRFLWRYSRRMVVWTSLLALLCGAFNAGLLAMINAVLNRGGKAGAGLLWCFIAFGLGRIVTNLLAQISLAHFSQENTARLRQDLVRKILAVPMRQLEEIGSPRLLVALTEDVLEITQAMLGIPAFGVNLGILIGGAVYLGCLSSTLLFAMGVFIALGAGTYRVLIRRGFVFLRAARTEEDQLFRHFRALTEGIKELKLHRERRDVFLSDNVRATTEAHRRHNVAAEMRFIVAANWSHLLFFALIGLILFLLPRLQSTSPREMSGYIIATLYLMGPLSGLLSSLSVFGRANVALSKIEQLGLALDARRIDECAAPIAVRRPELQRLQLSGVTHRYHREREDDHFMLGPVDLTFRTGELVFLAGGNGSGKSSLAKVITGLYPPAAGEIRLNGVVIADHNRDDYRQHFSAVFSDFYLFENLLGLKQPNLDAQARAYLDLLQLDHKVKIRDGVLSTVELSQGQRKRLALLTAYLEDRPFYLFDEWASDQDPLFKEVFYTQLLPELKARNKSVIVITHDDRYFRLADRLIKLDYGKIVSDEILDGGGDGRADFARVAAPAQVAGAGARL